MEGNLRQMMRRCWLPVAERAARSYIAGPALADGLQVCRSFVRRGVATTICFWNGKGDSPRHTADAYLAALDALAREKLNCSLSVKAPPLGFARDLLAEILERARQGGFLVHFDSLGPEAADPTFSLVAEALERYPKLGCTLPGRWRRSLQDADRAVELRLSVRVVKGQWVDPDEPTIDPATGFLAVIDRLAGRASHVAVATHDTQLACEALRRLLIADTSCEMELLLGLPVRRAVRVAREAGVPVRVYVPYGHACLPYGLSQARQDPRVLWWLSRDLLLGRSFRLPDALPFSLRTLPGALGHCSPSELPHREPNYRGL
jgi:proline dehydrogenase